MRIKIISIISTILCIIFASVFFLTNNNSSSEKGYESKVLYSDSLMATTVESSMETGYNLSDAVIRGKIVDIYQKDIELNSAKEISEKLGNNNPVFTCTYYTIDVEESYFGNVDKQITYREFGDFNEYCTKPTEESEVILFLNERFDENNNLIYVSTMLEHSIITINGSDQMYSYSNIPELANFDGKNVSEFKKKFDETAKEQNYKQNKNITFESN